MAEVIFTEIVDNLNNYREWVISSAGTWAAEGFASSPEVQVVMKDMGLDVSNHRSQVVSSDLLDQFNLILVMEQGHKEAIIVEFPDTKGRVFLLTEMVGRKYGIDDPIGGPLDAFRKTAIEIKNWLTEGYDRIVELSAQKKK